ncbi:MAG: 4-hydroxybutyrate CoA-transferase [Planctomycetes bacterium]|nr:4-hydroxybutyrate CoA-transferase [Planctomycetota bacterium]
MSSDWLKRAISAEELVAKIRSGQHVFVHGGAATPVPLVQALLRRTDLHDVNLYHLHLEGVPPIRNGGPHRGVNSMSLFTGPNQREPVAEGKADFIPVFLSDIPVLIRDRVLPIDVALLQLSPPDAHGICTLGTSVDAALAASRTAKVVLAEINHQAPRTHGNSWVPLSLVDAFTVTDRPLPSHELGDETPVEAAIGEQVAQLVDDGSCLQLGIGVIPNAVLKRLHGKQDLGIHTEMFSDGVVDLYRAGAITNARKQVHAGRIVTSFVVGSKKLYDFVDDHGIVEFHPCDRTNDVRIIAAIDNMVAVNSALEIDLSGQVCADSIGTRIYSGIGGQMDFIQGADLSRGGKPIIALPSTAASGRLSRIVPTLKTGAGVVTTRGHVNWVVTEHGAVNLLGRSLRQRAELLISIAHPDFRGELRRTFAELRHFSVG